MDATFVCPCGLVCCDCLFYRTEIYDAARRLKALLKESQLDAFLALCANETAWSAIGEHLGLDQASAEALYGDKFKPFREMATFLHVLDGIIRIQCATTCQEAGGCSVGGDTVPCTIKTCLKAKGYDGCWQCAGFEDCTTLDFLKKGYGHVVVDNLRIIKDRGAAAVPSRGNRYYAWQRR